MTVDSDSNRVSDCGRKNFLVQTRPLSGGSSRAGETTRGVGKASGRVGTRLHTRDFRREAVEGTRS